MTNDSAMPARPARAVLPIRWVYDVGEVGKSKFSTHETFLKSIPRETPYSLSFLDVFLFFRGRSTWSASASITLEPFFEFEEFASSSLSASG